MKLMVFDVGGTEIKYCVMDESLAREEAGSVPTPMSTQEAVGENRRTGAHRQ